LNGVHDGSVLVQARKRRLKLENTAWIAGGNDVSVERSNELSLAVSESVCGLRLDKIVNSRGAATNWCVRDLGKIEAGNA